MDYEIEFFNKDTKELRVEIITLEDFYSDFELNFIEDKIEELTGTSNFEIWNVCQLRDYSVNVEDIADTNSEY